MKAIKIKAGDGKRLLRRLAPLGLLWTIPFLILMSFFISEVLKTANYLETFPKELVFPTLMHAFSALIIAAVTFLARRPAHLAAKLVSAALLALFFVNYGQRFATVVDLLRAVLPILPEKGPDVILLNAIVLAGVFALSLAAGRLLERLADQRHWTLFHSSNLTVSLSLFAGLMFLSQFVPLARVLPSMIAQSAVQSPQFAAPTAAPAATKPDIYYLVFDRYASQKTLSDQLSFSNAPLLDYLAASGFTTNNAAYSNYPYTGISVSSTLAANYTKDQVAPFVNQEVNQHTLFHNLNRTSPVIRALKQAGYKYYSIGSTYGATNQAPLADVDYAAQHAITIYNRHFKRLRGVESSQFLQSLYAMFAPAAAPPWWPFRGAEVQAVEYDRVQFLTLDELASDPHPGGRFILAHILVPHEPYFFNGDGSLSTFQTVDSVGKPIKQKYLGQVEFVNNQIKPILEKINKLSDGQSVVLLNADEGPYPSRLNSTFENPTGAVADAENIPGDDMRKWSDDWLQMKYGILQAAHIPAATPDDLANLSSVNLFRIVLNRYLGYQLPYLPNCHFALSSDSAYEFRYADITQRLTGTANPACAQYQTAP